MENNIANYANIFACVRFTSLRSIYYPVFKCYKFMKVRTHSTLSRTKYVKCFRVETSSYRLVFRLKFIVTLELRYNQAESDFVQCQTKLRAFLSAVNLNKLNSIELFIKMLYGVWSPLQPDHDANKSPRPMPVSPPARNDDRSPI